MHTRATEPLTGFEPATTSWERITVPFRPETGELAETALALYQTELQRHQAETG